MFKRLKLALAPQDDDLIPCGGCGHLIHKDGAVKVWHLHFNFLTNPFYPERPSIPGLDLCYRDRRCAPKGNLVIHSDRGELIFNGGHLVTEQEAT